MWSPAFASYIFKICVAIIKDKAKRLLKSLCIKLIEFSSLYFNAFCSY